MNGLDLLRRIREKGYPAIVILARVHIRSFTYAREGYGWEQWNIWRSRTVRKKGGGGAEAGGGLSGAGKGGCAGKILACAFGRGGSGTAGGQSVPGGARAVSSGRGADETGRGGTAGKKSIRRCVSRPLG